MINAALAILGFVVLYLCWNISMSSWSRLAELGIAHKKSSTSYFDSILVAGIVGTIVSRLAWMALHLSAYSEVPWGILPYSRSATEFVWFTLFPWRFLRVTEGLLMPSLWVIMGIISVLSVFVPTIKLAMKLRLEKRGIMRTFLIKNILGAVVAVAYFALLTYLVW